MRQRFDLEFQALLDRDNPDTRSIWCFVERTLRQYKLDAFGVTATEILSEVYARGIRQIVERKQGIENPLGWIRVSAHYVILEHSRRVKRSVSLESVSPSDSDLTVLGEMDKLITKEEIEADIHALYLAMEQLTPREREILYWRHTQDLSWQEVGKRLIDCGENEVGEATLRQRGCRALARLRQLFHACRMQEPPDDRAA